MNYKLNPLYWLDRFEKLDGGTLMWVVIAVTCTALVAACLAVIIY